VRGYIDGYLALTLHGDTPKYLVTKERYAKHDFDLYKKQYVSQYAANHLVYYFQTRLTGNCIHVQCPLINVYMAYKDTYCEKEIIQADQPHDRCFLPLRRPRKEVILKISCILHIP
jgi:hypothetical protein